MHRHFKPDNKEFSIKNVNSRLLGDELKRVMAPECTTESVGLAKRKLKMLLEWWEAICGCDPAMQSG